MDRPESRRTNGRLMIWSTIVYLDRASMTRNARSRSVIIPSSLLLTKFETRKNAWLSALPSGSEAQPHGML